MRISDWSSDVCSSDLRTEVATEVQGLAQSILDRYQTGIQISTVAIQNVQPPEQVQAAFDDAVKRSEEHTSELQSLMRISYAVFCLKKKHTMHHDTSRAYLTTSDTSYANTH